MVTPSIQSTPSLAEFIAQAERGYFNQIFGPNWMQKQNTYFGTEALAGTPTTTGMAAGVFTATFGRKVWHALNNQARIFNALKRTVWGNTAGWRVRTDRGGTRSRPVTEVGTLPTINVSTIQTV